jgi:hypothetical protein
MPQRTELLPTGYEMTITPQPWIAVSERLPEKDGSVLVAWDTREPVGIGHFSDGEWVDPHFAISEYGRPTHWMPLPEPPEVK